jgi:hypothetical protein
MPLPPRLTQLAERAAPHRAEIDVFLTRLDAALTHVRARARADAGQADAGATPHHV